jgi:hypothetical protein
MYFKKLSVYASFFFNPALQDLIAIIEVAIDFYPPLDSSSSFEFLKAISALI